MTKNKYNWESVDWGRQDVEIARDFGCSRERVRQVRVDPKIGMGRIANKPRGRTGDTATSVLSKIDTECKTLSELSDDTGYGEHSIGLVLNSLGNGFKRRTRGGQLYDWSKFPTQWREMKDKEIATLVGAEYPAVVAQWRKRHGHQRGGQS